MQTGVLPPFLFAIKRRNTARVGNWGSLCAPIRRRVCVYTEAAVFVYRGNWKPAWNECKCMIVIFDEATHHGKIESKIVTILSEIRQVAGVRRNISRKKSLSSDRTWCQTGQRDHALTTRETEMRWLFSFRKNPVGHCVR